MEIITKEDGTRVEVYTAEELEQQKLAAIEEYKTSNPDKTEEVNQLQAELTKLNEELGGFKDKDLNFANLRKQKEAAEGKIELVRKELDAKIDLAKKEVLEGVMKDHYNETLNNLSSGDVEVKKKIEFQYKRIGDNPNTKEEVSKKMRDAYLLATGTSSGGIDMSAFSSGGVSRLNIKNQTKTFTPEEKEFGKKLAQAGNVRLEDKDFV